MKKTIVDFAVLGVERFLQEHPGLEFYAFAFDCNAEYGEVNLCLNTETCFSRTLDDYPREKDINRLKYNTGDWEYQCFDTLYVLSDEQLDEIFQSMPEDDYQTWQTFVEHLRTLFTEALWEFTQTPAYQNIPKTQDFMAFCVDHDENIDDAWNRVKKIMNSPWGAP
jgi:hypothetical protein